MPPSPSSSARAVVQVSTCLASHVGYVAVVNGKLWGLQAGAVCLVVAGLVGMLG